MNSIHASVNLPFRSITIIGARIVAAAAVLVLAGWIIDNDTLKSVSPKFVSMKVNTAICFLFSALSLLFFPSASQTQRKHFFGTFSAMVVLCISFATLVEYSAHIDIGIDQIFIQEPAGTIGTAYSGRMAVNTSMNFVLIGLSLLFIRQNTKPLIIAAQVFALIAATVGLLGIFSYLYDIQIYFSTELSTRMAIHTAVVFDILALTILFIRPEEGLMKPFTARVVAAEALRKSEEHYRRLTEAFPNGTVNTYDRDLRMTYVGGSDLKKYNVEASEFLGKTFYELSPPETVAIAEPAFRKAFLGETVSYDTPYYDGRYYHVVVAPLYSAKNEINEILVISQDVSDTFRLETKAQESKEQYRLLFENSPIGIGIADADGNLIAYNKSLASQGGYTSDDLSKIRHVVDLYYDHQDREILLSKFRKDGFVKNYELRFKRKDGSPYDATISLTQILFNGKPSVQAVIEDISERKKSQRLVEEWSAKFGSVWENSIEAMRLTDGEGKVIKVNQAFCVMFKKSKDEIEGGDMQAVHHDDFKESVIQQYCERFIKRSIAQHYEGIVHLWNGEDIVVEGTHTFLEIPSQPTLLLSVFRDITERKKAAEALIESEKKFRTVVEEASEIIFTVNNDGYFTYANPAATRSTGFTVEGMKGKSIWELVEPNYRRSVMTTFIRQRSHKIAEATIEFPVTTMTGERKWFNLNSRLLKENSTVSGFYVIARDVTEIRIATEALLESERKYKDLFNYSPLGIYQSLPNGDLLSVNKAMAVMLGYDTAAELLKLNLARNIYYDPLERDRLIKAHEPHGSASDTEIRWKKKNGESIWVQMDARAIKNEQGTTVMFEGFIRNITDRKNAEAALIESEERFRSVTQSAQEAIITTDRSGTVVQWNNGAARIFGYNELEILGKKLEKILPSAHYHHHRTAVIESHRLNEPRIALKLVETTGRNKEGSEFPVEISVAAWSTSSGEFITEIIRDVSERKKSEELQLLFTTAFESAANGITITDINGEIIWVNRAFTRMTGYSLQEVKGRNPKFLKSGEQTAEHYKNLWETILAGNIWKGEMVNRKKDGTTYIDEMTITPVRNDKNAISHFVAIKQDVTSRNRILEQIEQQARLLAEANDAIIVRDMEHRILYWNKGAEKMYGWMQDEVIGKDVREILGYDPTVFQHQVDQLIATGEVTGEFQHIDKHKKEILADVRLSVIRDQKGKPKAVMSINTDITEKKKIESQIRRSQRLDSLGTLAGGIAHDLNNVLSPILLSIEILKKEYTSQNAQKIITGVESSAKRGSDIVKQILMFARGIESKNTVMQCRHLVNELVSIFKETFPRSITIEKNIPSDVSTILADPTHFHQLIMNLAVNARDAMPNGGTLTISAENRFIDEQYAKMNIEANPGKYVMFSVADTGIGMSEEVLNRMYEPFFTTKQVGEGTGLGLSTVHSIVKGLKGFIEVKSKPGHGTVFSIYVPAADSTEIAPVARIEKHDRYGNNELILIVDDEDAIRTVTKKTLEMYHYRVLTATDGADGLAVYVQHQKDISLVITDMMMPVMDGKKLINALRKINPSIRIIASSGLIDNQIDVGTGSGTLNGFLSKPYTSETLLKTVSSVFRNESSQRNDEENE